MCSNISDAIGYVFDELLLSSFRLTTYFFHQDEDIAQ